ncbi:MAG: hypothetical protein IJF08_09215 [Clostridia bacterium]|nr:hypothetical protein [Clostridia bacterium]
MKKLLILLALCMVFSVVLVACETTPDTSDETTDAKTTTEEVTTQPEAETSTEEVTTEPDAETSTEEVTTEPDEQTTPEEESTEPTPEPVKVIAAMSWDTLATIHPVIGKAIINNGGEYGTWNGTATIDTNDTALSLFGWIAYFTETEGTVGYCFNDGEHVYNDAFTFTAESGVQDHIHSNCPGALSACRFQFDIPLADLGAGTHKLSVFAKDPAGNEELIKDITLIIEQVDPVEELKPVVFDGTNGTVTVEAGGVCKFTVEGFGGKTMTIANSAQCTVTAGTYTLPADTIGANSERVQFIPGPGEGWDSFELTIHNTTGAELQIVLTIQ